MQRVGRRLTVLPETDSTNDHAWRTAQTGGQDGDVFFAEYQTKGRGRLGRSWQAPRGAAVLCSTILFEQPDTALIRRIVLLTALAACDAVADATELNPQIRWPNDLVISGRKLGGILIEKRDLSPGRIGLVVGVGINCLQQRRHFNPDLREEATSLEIESCNPVDRNAVGRCLIARMDRWFTSAGDLSDDDLSAHWRERAAYLAARIRLQADGKIFAGQIIDVDPSAALIVELDEGARRAFDPLTSSVLSHEPA